MLLTQAHSAMINCHTSSFLDKLVASSVELEYGMGWVCDWDTEEAEPIVISLPDAIKTTADNLVAQALHVTSLLYHFRSLTQSFVVLFPPTTERLDSSHMCIC